MSSIFISIAIRTGVWHIEVVQQKFLESNKIKWDEMEMKGERLKGMISRKLVRFRKLQLTFCLLILSMG